MAIRIKTGTRRTSGRFTMPKGTYLSNPSTAADGVTEGGSGTLPPTPQVNMWAGVTPGYNQLLTSASQYNVGISPLQQIALAYDVFSKKNIPGYSAYGTSPQIPGYSPYAVPPSTPSNNSILPAPTKPNESYLSPQAPSNQLVGNTLQPGEIAYTTLANVDRTKTLSEINDMMTQMGYTQTYKYGVGIVYVPNPNATPTASQNPQGIYGQGGYSSVAEAGASLAPGESYQSGNVYVQGGTPAASGESQYAVTYNNPNAKNDKHGKYKMVDYVTKDVNGNFVHVYRQELRKVYRRNSQKRNAGRGATTPAPQVGEANQLVTFRANFG